MDVTLKSPGWGRANPHAANRQPPLGAALRHGKGDAPGAEGELAAGGGRLEQGERRSRGGGGGGGAWGGGRSGSGECRGGEARRATRGRSACGRPPVTARCNSRCRRCE